MRGSRMEGPSRAFRRSGVALVATVRADALPRYQWKPDERPPRSGPFIVSGTTPFAVDDPPKGEAKQWACLYRTWSRREDHEPMLKAGRIPPPPRAGRSVVEMPVYESPLRVDTLVEDPTDPGSESLAE